MTVSRIKALFMVDPESARAEVMSAFRECEGCAEEAAEQLGVHYQTLFRLVKSDTKLASLIREAREEFRRKGVTQRGYGAWHEEASQYE